MIVRRAAQLDGCRAFGHGHRRDPAIGDSAPRRERQHADPTRHIRMTVRERSALQVTENVHFATGEGLRVYDARRAIDGLHQIQPLPARPGAVDRCEQRFAGTAAHHAVAEYQPDPIRRRGARERRARNHAQPV